MYKKNFRRWYRQFETTKFGREGKSTGRSKVPEEDVEPYLLIVIILLRLLKSNF